MSSLSKSSSNDNMDEDEDIFYEYRENHQTKTIGKRELQQREQKGAWALLAALEKAKEAQYVEVASLITSLETLLPREGQQGTDENGEEGARQPVQCSSRSNKLPRFSVEDTKSLTGDDVVALLEATRSGRLIEIHTIRALIEAATVVFRSRHPDRLVELPPLSKLQQVQVVGDLHGSLNDLATVLALMQSRSGEPCASNRILFNGDLADRGEHGVEVICIVCALKLAYPEFVFVNRGNHEDLALAIAYGLAAEITRKYGAGCRKVLRPTLDAFFRALPLATVIERDALIVHAGPPPPSSDGSGLADLLLRDHPILTGCGLSRTVVDTGCKNDNSSSNNKLQKEEKVSKQIIESMLWSDPLVDECEGTLHDFGDVENDISGTGSNRWVPNISRGAGYKYDASVVRNLLNREGLSRMVRSHEPVRDGCVRYVIDNSSYNNSSCPKHKNKPMELFTVFSASRYPYKEGFNQGAVLELKANGEHSVLRYATEDDEPLEVAMTIASSSVTEENSRESRNATREYACAIDSDDIRHTLLEALRYNRTAIRNSLRLASVKHQTIPFETVVDIVIETLNLGNEGNHLKQIGAKTTLAKAMGIQCPDTELPPEHVDVDRCFEVLLANPTDRATRPQRSLRSYDSYPWLFSVFELLDTNQDGFLSRSEWDECVRTINSKLPEGLGIAADRTWEVLDTEGYGKITMAEWERLGHAIESDIARLD
ncbi:unnamed protein product [Pseudo-nitzschia multistriata]|uniref:Serine/threonine-protein phosphatase n=1 Tax=Pseudo-nitzschia multistriata TaxID=183589 RepID=A0A448Z5L4_9STRA|nr:unnamed protein product [Pseudo-nitzschia multistriata]